ncbi:MAG: redoxin domain-containing protein [Janthinobacterium lividum]
MPQLPAPGTPAPAFTLHAMSDQALSLFELCGKPVVLVFCPADRSPVRGDEMALLNQVRPAFQGFGADVLGITYDGLAPAVGVQLALA